MTVFFWQSYVDAKPTLFKCVFIRPQRNHYSHAGTSKRVFKYLALKVLQFPVGKSLPYKVIEKLLNLVIDIIVCVRSDKKGYDRHITELWHESQSKYEDLTI